MENKTRDFPGGPVVETSHCGYRRQGLISGEGTKVPHVLEAKRTERGKRKKNKTKPKPAGME